MKEIKIPQNPIATGPRPGLYVDKEATYTCLLCGRKTAGHRITRIPLARCYHCGSYIFRRTKPLTSRDVGFRFVNPYNRFIKNIRKIARKYGVRPGVKLGSIKFEEPSANKLDLDGSRTYILPYEARVERLTYAAPMFSKASLGKPKAQQMGVYLGEMPVMVKSVLCPLSTSSPKQLRSVGESPDDPGGYFIINGVETAIPPKFISELFEFCFDEMHRKLASKLRRGRRISRRDFQLRVLEALEKRDPRVWGMVENPLFQFGRAVSHLGFELRS